MRSGIQSGWYVSPGVSVKAVGEAEGLSVRVAFSEAEGLRVGVAFGVKLLQEANNNTRKAKGVALWIVFMLFLRFDGINN